MWSQNKTLERSLSDTIEEEHKEREHVPCRKGTGDGDFCLLKAPREEGREDGRERTIRSRGVGGWVSEGALVGERQT